MYCQLSGSILIETSYGNLLFGLYGQDCPQTSKNFLDLCSLGFYDGCHIPRVVRNGFFEIRGHTHPNNINTNNNSIFKEQTASEFIQNLNGENTSGANTMIPLEIGHQLLGGLLPSVNNNNNNSPNQPPRTNKPVCVNKAGLLVMVAASSTGNNNNNNSGTRSTFLITTTDRRLDYLDRKHVILGELLLLPHSVGNNSDDDAKNKSMLKILREINSLALKGGKETNDGEPIRRVHIKRIHVLDRGNSVCDMSASFPSMKMKFMELLCKQNILLKENNNNNHNIGKYVVNYSMPKNANEYYLSSGDDFEENNNNLQQNRFFSNNSTNSNNSNNELKLLEAQLREVRQKIKRKRDDETQKVIMQLIGERPTHFGLDDGDEVKPPDNVLFVCKLNPLTQDVDLAHCFDRFGKILSCEIVRDKKSGRSLQYAFIEFETADSCELAFRKMEKVKIDDSRIHVDFSQSLGKSFWQARNSNNHNNFFNDERRRQQSDPGYYPQQQRPQPAANYF